MTVLQTHKQPLIWLVLATFSVFLGRGLQHFVTETPYRAFFWDEYLFGKSGILAPSFATNVFTDAFIDNLGFTIGFFFLLTASILLAAYIRYKHQLFQIIKYLNPLLYTASILLLILSLLYSKDHFYEIPQLLEYTCQFMSPILLAQYLKHGWTQHLAFLSKMALSITFACHGIYAIGLLPIPVHFMEMTMGIMNMNEDAAILFLKLAGTMDFVVAVLIFFPERIKQSGLIYMIIWGSLTALARLVYIFEFTPDILALFVGFSKTILRFPHFLIPLLLFQNIYLDSKIH